MGRGEGRGEREQSARTGSESLVGGACTCSPCFITNSPDLYLRSSIASTTIVICQAAQRQGGAEAVCVCVCACARAARACVCVRGRLVMRLYR